MTNPDPAAWWTTDTTAWWAELERLATVGPGLDELEAAEAFISQAEAMTAAAKALLRPKATTPAKSRLQCFPITPRSS